MEEHEKHQQELIEAFGEVVRTENEIAEAKSAFEQVQAEHATKLRSVEAALGAAWAKVDGLLLESGEVSVVLPGTVTDYEIYRTTPRESVKLIDPAAVPDTFCKVERKPKLKEIADYLRAQGRASLTLPNWAALELGESRWAWKAVKKKAVRE